MIVRNFNLGDISRYRTELMGFSAILILFCHSIAYIKMPQVLYYAISFGNIGVDIFLFLSGMGMWYSFSKSDKSIIKWYGDRYKKLFVPYLNVVLSIEIVNFALGKQLEHGIWNWLFGISSLRFYVSHDAAWFIAALIPLYFFSPWFYCLIKKYRWKAASILIILHYIILFIPPESSSELFNSIVKNIQFVTVRATCFVLGMALGQNIKEDKSISAIWMIIAVVMGGAAVVLTRHLVYGYFFFTLPLLYVFCFIIQKGIVWLRWCAKFMGKISLESYIFNGALPTLMISAFLTLNIPTANNFYPYIVACALGTILSYVFHRISERILNYITYLKNKQLS